MEEDFSSSSQLRSFLALGFTDFVLRPHHDTMPKLAPSKNVHLEKLIFSESFHPHIGQLQRGLSRLLPK
jgi:hypothetical protein